VIEPMSGRDQMLARLVAHVRAHGLPADCSLRKLAQELGTSHRMLAYYFSSLDGLLATVLSAMRTEDRQTLATTAENWGLRDAAMAMWSYYTDDGRSSEHRAFFYVFALALQHPEAYREFLASFDGWGALTADLAAAQGMDRAEAARLARLVVSSIRGLLMDRLTTSDPTASDAAFELLLDAVLPPEPAGRRSRTRKAAR
jgi:AcrR family transcriptional regulator